MVDESVAEGCGFGCALGGVVIARCLYDPSKLAVGTCEAGVRFLHMHRAKFHAEIRFCQTESYSKLACCFCRLHTVSGSLPLLALTTLSTFCPVSIVPK